MKAYGEPQIQHFGDGNKSGYTMIQLIETSNITAHFCEETGDAYIDVFSCKSFTKENVVDEVETFFIPEKVYTNFLVRDARLV